MRRLALRRFPDAIVRRRQGVGAFDEYGEWIQGQIVTVVLPASIQPVKLEDSDFPGGVSLVDRLKVYVPVGIERVVTPGDTLRWERRRTHLERRPAHVGRTYRLSRWGREPLGGGVRGRGRGRGRDRNDPLQRR